MFNFGFFSNSFSVFLCTMTKRILLFKLFSLEVYFFTEVRRRSDMGRFSSPIPAIPRAAHSEAVCCPLDARSCKHGGRPPGVSRKKQAGQNARPAVSIKNRDFMRFSGFRQHPDFRFNAPLYLFRDLRGLHRGILLKIQGL